MKAITFQVISKKYNLTKERPILLKNIFKSDVKEEVWALQNISFSINQGETVGIIGENGSGKSTILKIISGITTPTKGRVEVTGRVASLIELGAGFHPDLTGIENIYLNGTLLGFTKAALDQKLASIIEFADIGKYITQPVRTYSSGMSVRLGFAVATALDPDILLIDEVLAVGDEQFQKKCLKTISDFQKRGKTIIFVSHSLSVVEQLCPRTIWIDQSLKKFDGTTSQAIAAYLQKTVTQQTNLSPDSDQIWISKTELLNSAGRKIHKFKLHDSLTLRIYLNSPNQVAEPIFGIHIHDSSGRYCHGSTTKMHQIKINSVKDKNYLDYQIEDLTLLAKSGGSLPNRYQISVFIQKNEGKFLQTICYLKDVNYFLIKDNSPQYGITWLNSSWSKVLKY